MPRPIHITFGDGELFALSAGDNRQPALVLLHGWPQSSAVFEPVIDRLGQQFFVLAFDLPGIGQSTATAASALKSDIASTLLDAAESVQARSILVAGLDVGGMIAFAAARDHGERIEGAVVMNTVIPGLDPWDELMTDPRIWHFAFHLVPDLPETMVTGRERSYFDFFFDLLSGRRNALPDSIRAEMTSAYEARDQLRTGFDWYRAMPKDAEHNGAPKSIETPLLYLRGDADGRPIEPYSKGLLKAGATKVRSRIVEGSGEFLAHEAPETLVAALRAFATEELRLLEPA